MPVWGVRLGEIAEGGATGKSSSTITEDVVHGVLLVLIQYLQAIQR
jgi:hypothetical protein